MALKHILAGVASVALLGLFASTAVLGGIAYKQRHMIAALRESMEREARRKKAEEEYREAERKDPWDFQFLPEGWSIFGQRHFPTITEYVE